MKNIKKLCLIPLYRPIICFFKVDNELKKKQLISNKTRILYFALMGILGCISKILTMLICKMFEIDYHNGIIRFTIDMLFLWFLLTIPAISYSKKLE